MILDSGELNYIAVKNVLKQIGKRNIRGVLHIANARIAGENFFLKQHNRATIGDIAEPIVRGPAFLNTKKKTKNKKKQPHSRREARGNA